MVIKVGGDIPITATVPTLFLLLVLLTSAIPYGGVALWAQTLTGLLCLMLASYRFHFGRRREAPPPAMAGSRFFALFFGWTALIACTHVVGSVIRGTGGSLPILSTTLFLWCAWSVLTAAARRIAARTRVLRTLITGMAIIASAQALIGIVGLYTPLGIYSKFVTGPRAVGTFSSGNSMGGFLALSLPPTLAMAQLAIIRAGKHIQVRRSRILHEATREDYCLLTAILWLLASLVQVVALLLSGSRGAITAALVTLLCLSFWFVHNRDRQQRDRLPVAAGILTTLLVLAIGAGGTYAFTLQRLRALETVQQTALPRTAIWQATLKQVAQHPLGAGPGRFADAFLPFQPTGYGGNRIYHAHNDYLEILTETGFPGLFLLLTAFALALAATTRHLLPARDGESVWMRRAALLSVAAGLIHAGVDFNLSSRPGVAALFFCLLGVALSRSPQATHEKPATPCSPRRLRRLGLGALCCLLALNQIRLATAATLMEQGFGALIGESSLYFWLPVPKLSDGQALDRLRIARRLAPESAEVHVRLARALVIVSDRRIQQAIESAQADNPQLPPAVLAVQIRVLMRTDERRLLSDAHQMADKACRLAPANADAKAQAAHITARLAVLATDHDDAIARIDRTLEHIATARQLAPNDATIHRRLLTAMARLADAVSAVEAPARLAATRGTGMATGLHLLHLGESQLENILDAWSRLGLDPFTVLEAVGPLPADAAIQLYHFYNRQQHPQAAIRALDTLERAIETGTLSAAGFRDSAQKADLLNRYRLQLIREQARWHLRQHRFDAYRGTADVRQEVLHRDIARKLEQTVMHDAVALRFRYLNLLDLHETRGLDEQHARELATRMRQHGESESAIANVLAPFQPAPPIAGSDDEPPDHRLDMQLLGGRVVLVGFSIRGDSIHSFWRFHSRVPSDLQAVFIFLDSQRAHVTSVAFRFTQVFGRAFAVGSPPIGKVFRTETPIPVTAALSEHLEIGLQRRSTRQWLPSIEGLARGEFHHWKALRRTAESAEAQKTD